LAKCLIKSTLHLIPVLTIDEHVTITLQTILEHYKMKNLILIFGSLLWLFMISCKGDDIDNDTLVINDKYLSEIHTKNYSGNEQSGYTIKEYENNKPIISTNYAMNNNVRWSIVWTYSNDKLEYQAWYRNNGPELIEDKQIEYDSFGRFNSIRSYIWELGVTGRTYFTYNSDNTITRKWINIDIPQDTTYVTNLLNEEGLIYKSIYGLNFRELIYDSDNNLVSELNPSYDVNYIYDDINLPPENFPVSDNVIFRNYPNNSILFQNIKTFHNVVSLVPKFMVKREFEGGSTNRWEWTFDDENYPLNMRIYVEDSVGSNSVLWRESEYFYD
jgi:hypothetical protein